MTKVVEKTKNGKTKEIDLSKVEKIAREYERSLFKRENYQDRRHVDYSIEILKEAKDLDKEQLEYLTTYLTGITNKLSDMYQKALDEPEKFAKETKKYKELMSKY